jgi:YHS domain-containing protein
LFASGEDRQRFMEAPDRYVPACSGNDPIIAAEEDRQVAGKIDHSAIYRGRLYLFSSSATLAQFREEPRRYAVADRASRQ